MGLIKGGFLRLSQTFLYVLAFCCSAVIVGIYSYFLAAQANRDVSIPTYAMAVVGISAVAVLFTLFAILLTCCLGGMAFFGLLAVVINVLTMGAFIGIAVLTRDGAHSCNGSVIRTGPLGPANLDGLGFENDEFYSVTPRTACRLNQAVFIVSIIGAFFFLLCALVQLLLVRSGRKEKHVGPSPDNDYTSGSGSRNYAFWKRNEKANNRSVDLETAVPAGTAAGGLASGGPDMRPSYDTTTTVGNGNGNVYDKEETAIPANSVVYGHDTALNNGTQHHHY